MNRGTKKMTIRKSTKKRKRKSMVVILNPTIWIIIQTKVKTSNYQTCSLKKLCPNKRLLRTPESFYPCVIHTYTHIIYIKKLKKLYLYIIHIPCKNAMLVVKNEKCLIYLHINSSKIA